MDSVADNVESERLMTKSDVLCIIKNEKNKCNRTPINNKKIVPCISTKVPEFAWTTNNDMSFKTQPNDEKCLLRVSNSSNYFEEDLTSTDCNYVQLPSEEFKFQRKYKNLTPSSSILEQSINESNQSKSTKIEALFRCSRYIPYFIIVASIIEICVYTYSNENVNNLLMFSPYERHEVWRFITYMLLHSELIHILLNVTIQILLAILIELEQGWWRCAVVYLVGGVSGALGTSVLQPNLYMVGASAGVYALLISHVANVILKYNTISYKITRLFSVFILAMSDIVYSIYHEMCGVNAAAKIGWASHLAGAIAGFAIGILIFKGNRKENISIIITTVITWIVFMVFIIGSIIYNIYAAIAYSL